MGSVSEGNVAGGDNAMGTIGADDVALGAV